MSWTSSEDICAWASVRTLEPSRLAAGELRDFSVVHLDILPDLCITPPFVPGQNGVVSRWSRIEVEQCTGI